MILRCLRLAYAPKPHNAKPLLNRKINDYIPFERKRVMDFFIFNVFYHIYGLSGEVPGWAASSNPMPGRTPTLTTLY